MLKKFGPSIKITIIATASGFGLHFLMAKVLSAEEYGTYNFIFNLSMTVMVFAMLGLQNGIVRFIPTYRLYARSNQYITRLIRFSTLFTLTTGIISGMAVFGLIYLFGPQDKFSDFILMLGAISVPAVVLNRLQASMLQGFKKSAASIFYESALRDFLMLALFILLLFYAMQSEVSIMNGATALIVWIGATLLTVCVSTVQILRLLSSLSDQESAGNETHPTENPSAGPLYWIKTSAPMFLIAVSKRLMRRTDIFILGFMVDLALVGAYALAVQIANGVMMVHKPAEAVFSPRAAESYARNDITRLGRQYWQSTLMMGGPTLVFSVIAALVVPYLLPYLGEGYMEGYNALLLLLLTTVIGSWMGPAGKLLIMTKYEVAAMKIKISTMTGNVLFTPVMVFYMGIEGAAFVTLIMTALQKALCLQFAFRKKLFQDIPASA